MASNPTPAQRAARLEAAGLAGNGRVVTITSDCRYERSVEPTPEELSAVDGVSRWGQEHPTPEPPSEVVQLLRADYEHDEDNANHFYPEPRR